MSDSNNNKHDDDISHMEWSARVNSSWHYNDDAIDCATSFDDDYVYADSYSVV